MDTFIGLKLAMNAMDAGGNIPTVFNSSNEEAVRMLLQGKISFLDIPEAISYAMSKMEYIDSPSVEEILYTEDKAINLVREFLK